jgi:hypothetical protein
MGAAKSKIQPILDLAMGLSEADRLEIASRLLESVPDDLEAMPLDDPRMIAELDRRFADDDANYVSLEKFLEMRRQRSNDSQ